MKFFESYKDFFLHSKIRRVLIFFILLICLLILFFPKFIDPDFYWHIRLGKEIGENHNWLNNLTYTCTNFLWINHSWLSDVIMFRLYDSVGYVFLQFIFSCIFCCAFFINYQNFKIIQKNLFDIKTGAVTFILLIFSFYFLVSGFIASRPQVLSFILSVILFNLLLRVQFEKIKTATFLIALLLLVILWVNLHGGFAVTFIYIGMFGLINFLTAAKVVFSETPDAKLLKISLKKVKILTSSIFIFFLGSLINPFGAKIWLEVFRNAFLSSRNTILIDEWMGINFKSPYGILTFLLFLVVLVLCLQEQKNRIIKLSLVIPITIISFVSVRYIFFSAAILPIFFSLEISSVLKKLNPIFVREKSLKTVIYFGIFVISLSYLSFNMISTIEKVTLTVRDERKFEVQEKYPIKAVEFLNDNPEFKERRFFNNYNWGGFLSYKSADIKWFIDGRMAVWNCGGISGSNAIIDFANINYLRQNWESLIERHQINAFLISKNSTLANVIDTKQDKWDKIYEDELSVIYVKI